MIMNTMDKKHIAVGLTLLAILALAFIQRISPMQQWDVTPEKYLVHGEPMLANSDGYYYLAAAQEILDGTYDRTETYRAYPDTVTRSPIPPLLSVFLAGWYKVTALPMTWAGAFMPCVLGLLLVVPVYYLGVRWCNPFTGIMATSMVLLSPFYASRTGLAVLDTDCLNVFFALNAVCLALFFGRAQGKKQYWWAAACWMNYLFYLWWWDQTLTAPTILALGPLAIAALLYYRPARSEGAIVAVVITAVFLVVGLLAGFDTYTDFFRSVWNSLSYISKQQSGLYLNVGESITEQKRMGLGDLATTTLLIPACFHLAIFGLIWLVARAGREVLILTSMGAIASLAVLFAGRFAIFMVPLVALGFASFIFLASQMLQKRSVLIGRCILGAGVAYCLYVGFAFYKSGIQRASFFHAETVAGMQELKKSTEKDAVIWSYWEEGHSLVYWGQRTTLGDGMIHGGQRNHCLAFPLTITDDRLAANFIQFYLTAGITGINRFYREARQLKLDGKKVLLKILAEGPEQGAAELAAFPGEQRTYWLGQFFSSPEHPVYLFLTGQMMRKKYWIFQNGSWDAEKQAAPGYLPFIGFAFPAEQDVNELPGLKNFHVDPVTLTLTLPQAFKRPIPLQKVTITDNTTSRQYHAPFWYKGAIHPEFQPTVQVIENQVTSGDYQLDIFLPEEKAYIQDGRAAESVMNRLFFRRKDYNATYFHPVALHAPYYQVWKVTGDRLK